MKLTQSIQQKAQQANKSLIEKSYTIFTEECLCNHDKRFQSIYFILKRSQPMQTRKATLNLSNFLQKTREYYLLSSKATFWFGGILSLVQQQSSHELNDDLSPTEKVQLIKIISSSLSCIASFYEQQRPNSVYKLLNFMQSFFDQLQGNKQYGVMLSKVNYLSILAVYSLKTHQYSFAHQSYSEILQIYNSKTIDCTNQIFLATFNNYLTFLKRSNKKMTSKMIEVEAILKDLFIRFFTKIMVFDVSTNKENVIGHINLLSSVLRQNKGLLVKYQKDVNAFVQHFYTATFKSKRKFPEDMVSFIFKEKVLKSIEFKIAFNEDQIKFYSAHKGKLTQSTFINRNIEQQPQKRLNKIEAMLQKSIQMLNQQKIATARYSTIDKTPTRATEPYSFTTIQTTNQSYQKDKIQSQVRSLQTLQPLPRSFTRKRQIIASKPISKPVLKAVKLKNITFKIRSIFIQINEDGILLSDYTKQNKRYIQWNTLSMIIDKIDLHFPFEEYLKIPMQNYYDFVRIIGFYLTKNDNKQICLYKKPMPLLEVNELIKLYKQEGKYLKLALMNHYDTDKFIGIIDCYISQFSEFFKNLNDNQYIMYLNEKVMKTNSNERQENTYLLDYLKRKRETTVAELGNQLLSQRLQSAIEERGTLYKCIFLLKNNLQLFVRINDNIKANTTFDNYAIEIRIDSSLNFGNQTFYLSSQKQLNPAELNISRLIEIPIEQLTHFFPPYGVSVRDYLSLYSRMIVDFMNSFQDYLDEINLGGISFDIKVHASRTQTIEYGKYFSLVSAELIGSKERIWGLIIRFYDLAFVGEKITVLLNPYFEFLQCAVNSSQMEKNKILRNLLIGESVKETYNWLKKANKLQRKINIFQYLYASQLI